MLRTTQVLLGSCLALCVSCTPQGKETDQVYAAWTPGERSFLLAELDRSHDAVIETCHGLSVEQWQFREIDDRWSIAEIVEHLQLQDLMFWRELYVITQFPDMHYYHGMRKAPDSVFVGYSTVTEQNTSEAPWYIVPRGRWASKQVAMEVYRETREKIRELVAATDKDFRQLITPRGWRDQAELRDLHQLLLLLVAHTDRHVQQIRTVLNHTDFPR